MKVMLITGTSRGIGKYLFDNFPEYLVSGCSRKDFNIGNEAEVLNLFHHSPGIDILINNAGIASMNHVLLTTGEKAKQIIETNFLGTFYCSREAAKGMIRKGHGRIINFSTIAVKMSLQGEAVYVASKAAVEALTLVMAKELPSTVTVNCLRLGVVDTELSKNAPFWMPRTSFEEIHGTIKDIINSDITGQIIEL
jgi:3-oxoacyl-[acyl-carrier protein] reductase